MRRRRLTRRELFGLLGYAGAYWGFRHPFEGGVVEQAPKPNILLVITDDEPFTFAGSDPQGDPWMPKTHAALGGGLYFRNAYLPVPLCGPSRASLFTGRYVHNHNVSMNLHASLRFRRAGHGMESLGKRLADAGYNVGLAGKSLNQSEETPGWVWPGFRFWVNTFTDRNPVRGNILGRIRKTSQAKRDETSYLAAHATNFIQAANAEKAKTGRPWFMVFSPSAPHDPYTPSQKNAGSFDGVAMPQRPNFDHHDPNKPADVRKLTPMTQQERGDMARAWRGKMEERRDVDDAVERLAAAVDFEDTYIVYMTDNGYLLGEHGCYRKAKPYDESTKTPLWVKGPGVREDAASDLLVSGVDVTATVLELAGYDAEDPALALDGRSLLGPMVEPDEANLEWRDALFVGQPGDYAGRQVFDGWRMLRTRDRVYVEHDSAEREYYDMANDPYQLANLAPQADAAETYEYSRRLAALSVASGEDLRAEETA